MKTLFLSHILAQTALTASLLALGSAQAAALQTTPIPRPIIPIHHPLQRLLIVDQTADSTTGNCDVAGQCNLRAAVTKAASLSLPTTLRLDVDVVIDQGQIEIPAGQRLTIQGQGVKAITGTSLSRLFLIDAEAQVSLKDLVISRFLQTDGGAIVNSGALDTTGVTFQDNHADCSGVGAMTAYSSCTGGAIQNFGTLVLSDGTLFQNNQVTSEASTASFTTSTANGGAVYSTGTVRIDGLVVFSNNLASSGANSGIHPLPDGGATADAAGGALVNAGGELIVTAASQDKCLFQQNQAESQATTVQGTAAAASRGGAVASNGGHVEGLESCMYAGNQAATDADRSVAP